jgi:hypothetical protein
MLKTLIRPSSNIAIVSDFEDTIIYKAHCSCLDDNDIHTLVLEIDPSFDDITMILYAKVAIDEYYNRSDIILPLRILWRIKNAIKILFTGHLDLEASYLFTDEQAVHDYIKALEYGLGKLSTWKYRIRDLSYITDEVATKISREVRNHKWEKETKKKPQ